MKRFYESIHNDLLDIQGTNDGTQLAATQETYEVAIAHGGEPAGWANLILFNCYWRGWGVPQAREQAKAHLAQASDCKGEPGAWAHLNLGLIDHKFERKIVCVPIEGQLGMPGGLISQQSITLPMPRSTPKNLEQIKAYYEAAMQFGGLTRAWAFLYMGELYQEYSDGEKQACTYYTKATEIEGEPSAWAHCHFKLPHASTRSPRGSTLNPNALRYNFSNFHMPCALMKDSINLTIGRVNLF